MDPDIANWILELLLRQPPLEDWLLNSLLRFLPLPINNPNFQKSLLLKKLDSEVSRRSITVGTLALLERLEEMEFRRGNAAVSDAMKRAYCAVAVECSLRQLVQGDCDDKERDFKLFVMVRKVWRGRIARMKALEKGGLGSEELWAWGREIEAAAWEKSVRKRVIDKFEGVRTEEVVRVYLREERERMGPSFLESLPEKVKCDGVLQRIIESLPEKVKCDGVLQRIMGIKGILRVGVEETPTCRVDRRCVDRAGVEETPSYRVARVGVEETPLSCHVDRVGVEEIPSCSVDRVGVEETRSCRVGRVDVEETPSCRVGRVGVEETLFCHVYRGVEETPSCSVDWAATECNASEEIDRVALEETTSRCAVDGSNAEKHKRQKIVDSNATNAKPKYRRLPSSVEVNRAREALVTSTMELRAVVKDPLPEALRVAEEISKLQKAAEDINGGDAMAGEERHKRQKPAEERNTSAHTSEWDDSPERSSEDVARRAVPQLHTPKRICTSPLKPYEFKKIKRRRTPRKWSLQEEEALRKRVRDRQLECYPKILWRRICR